MKKFARLPEVQKDYAPVSKATLYRWIKDGQFPAPVKIGRSSAWHVQDLERWSNERIAERDGEVVNDAA